MSTINNAINIYVASSYSTSVPVIQSSTGWTSITLGFSLLQQSGSILTMSATFAGTPSATTQTLLVLAPVTNPFTSTLQASGTGSMYLSSSPTALTAGFVNIIKSANTTRNIEIDSSCLAAGVGVAFTMQVVFMLQAQ
jgi:hypothetical protein